MASMAAMVPETRLNTDARRQSTLLLTSAPAPGAAVHNDGHQAGRLQLAQDADHVYHRDGRLVSSCQGIMCFVQYVRHLRHAVVWPCRVVEVPNDARRGAIARIEDVHTVVWCHFLCLFARENRTQYTYVYNAADLDVRNGKGAKFKHRPGLVRPVLSAFVLHVHFQNWDMDVRRDENLVVLDDARAHDDNLDLLDPYHAPEVNQCASQRTLQSRSVAGCSV